MERSNRFLRTISFILLQSFILQQISWADVISPAKKDVFVKPGVSFVLPESVASIEDVYQAPNVIASEAKQSMAEIASSTSSPRNDNRKTIYLLQDAHTNESGQLNLSKALDLILKKEPSLKYVFTEAGVDDNSLSFLRPYKTLPERQKLALSYVKKGLLHGAEHLDLTSNHDFILWGVESPELYTQALNDYKAVVSERDRFDLYLKKIDSTLTTLKARLLNPSLSSFDREMNAFQKEEITLTQYFGVLLRESTLQNLDLNQYPHLKSLLRRARESKAMARSPR